MTEKQSKCVVRKAMAEDIPEVRDLIQELADFEKMSDGPKLSTEDILRDAGLTGGKEFMHCYVAETMDASDTSKQRILVGYAICFFSYSTWEGKSYFLEDIYVKPQYRKSGVGRMIFKYVAQMSQQFKCPRLDFHVLDWNPARGFYDKMGATNLTNKEGWHFYRMNTKQIDELLCDK